MKKLLNLLRSRVVVTVITGVLDVLILVGNAPAELKPLAMELVTALGVAYVALESVADIVGRIKNTVD